ncbi:MAG: ribbon-helix-helix protein, CopG family [Bryobacteraceae bacterium]
MRRTQLYLDDQLWDALHIEAKAQNATVSELVRQAVRQRYLGDQQQRLKAMKAFIGSRKAAADAPTAEEEVRALRRGTRLERMENR